MKIMKRYKVAILIFIFNILLGLSLPDIGIASFEITKSNIYEMLGVLPPIFVLLGLLDVWVDKEVMMRYVGKGSGIKGAIISFALGACAAGPLYAAFPVASVMLKKGSGLFNTFLFIGAWSTAKIPLLTFEATSLGIRFMSTRLLLNLIGLPLIAIICTKALTKQEKDAIYDNAMNA
ncbi:permease [Tannockella kyphosi]|uniref:permease n=1 Tax=Tannockella kyphosi TaxID=2899121 RepID=UPI002011B86F|nr:permease [Tannockella kyphosi]